MRNQMINDEENGKSIRNLFSRLDRIHERPPRAFDAALRPR